METAADFAPWNHGAPAGETPTEPPIQVQRFDQHTVVLRQSKSVDYEAPFLYLFFGADRAILFDTGATADRSLFPLRDTVDALVGEWLAAHPAADYQLVVAHSHSHDDHVAGDVQFHGRANTTVVGADADSVRDYFVFGDDVDVAVTFDLGGRALEIVRIPGHNAASVAVFDPRTGWLLTGDTIYRGRLYIDDAEAFVDSSARLVAFARDRDVTHVMGCHIEMTTTPGVDYPAGTTWQPNEPPLPMSPAHLDQVAAAAHLALVPGSYVFDDFIIVSRQPAT